MAEGTTTFAFKEGDRVQFKDGRHVRQGFIVTREQPDDEHPAGYTIMFKMKETGQNRLVRWAANDLAAAQSETFAFKVGDEVVVTDGAGDEGVRGKVYEVLPSAQDRLEPQYAVLFKDENGMSALAWWGESILAAAS